MKKINGIVLLCMVSSIVFAQNIQASLLHHNNPGSWPTDTLELAEPILDKVFPGVRFYLPPAWPSLGYEIEIHGQYKDTTYLFLAFNRFDFYTLFKRIKSETNCSLEDRLKALLFLHTYVEETYISSAVGILKYDEYLFKVDILQETINNIGSNTFNWYSKCNSQNGYVEYYIDYRNDIDRIVQLYVVYNGQIIDGHKNGIYSLIH